MTCIEFAGHCDDFGLVSRAASLTLKLMDVLVRKYLAAAESDVLEAVANEMGYTALDVRDSCRMIYGPKGFARLLKLNTLLRQKKCAA